MPETPYTETEALLLALADAEADSGNTDELDLYLTASFTTTELMRLKRAAELLSFRAGVIWRAQMRVARKGGG